MKCYIISYDLNNASPERYQLLQDSIKSLGAWAHINLSVWAVITSSPASSIRDLLKAKVGATDSIFVVKSGTEAAWSNVICSNEWLKNNL